MVVLTTLGAEASYRSFVVPTTVPNPNDMSGGTVEGSFWAAVVLSQCMLLLADFTISNSHSMLA